MLPTWHCSKKNYILYHGVIELHVYVIRNMYKRIKREDRSDDAVAKKVNSSLTAVVKSRVTKLLYLCDPVLLNIIIEKRPVKTGCCRA